MLTKGEVLTMRDKYTDGTRVGLVSSIDETRCTAQVCFQDRKAIATRDLHIVVPFTLADKSYYMPSIGERVLCLFHPEAPTKGWIIGSYYADNRLPAFGDRNKAYTLFEDMTLIEYDKSLHKLTIHVPNVSKEGDKSIEISTAGGISVCTQGNLIIEAVKDVDILTAQTINIMATSNINITAAESVNIQADSDVTITASGNINMSAAEIHLNG